MRTKEQFVTRIADGVETAGAGCPDERRNAVSVVIPTTGRASLLRAVQSVLDQEAVTVEVIVVMNGRGPVPHLPPDHRVRVITLEAGVGANVARHQGILSSGYPILALLDDDDVWLPSKLKNQLDMIAASSAQGSQYVVGCRIAEPCGSNHETVRPTIIPESPIYPVAGYLFRRDSLRSRRPQLQTSTLVFPRSVYELVQFDGTVPIHQDWEWILKVEKAGAQVMLHPEVLALCEKGDAGTITANTKWWQSVNWAQERLDDQTLRSDFLLTIALRFALKGRSIRGVVTCLRLGLRPSRATWRASFYALGQTGIFLPSKILGDVVRSFKRLAKGNVIATRAGVGLERSPDA